MSTNWTPAKPFAVGMPVLIDGKVRTVAAAATAKPGVGMELPPLPKP